MRECAVNPGPAVISDRAKHSLRTVSLWCDVWEVVYLFVLPFSLVWLLLFCFVSSSLFLKVLSHLLGCCGELLAHTDILFLFFDRGFSATEELLYLWGGCEWPLY